MKKVLVLLLTVIIVLSVIGAFSACNGSGDDGLFTVTIGTTSAIENAVRDEYAYDNLASATSEIPLVSKSANGEYSPLAVSYETADFKSWTLTVKNGLTWSDGTPVTAEDIVFSFDYESTAEKPAFSTDEITGTYESYTISDDKKSVTLIRESAAMTALDEMAVFRIRPMHIYKDKSADELTTEDKRVSCGPYVLSNFDKASSSLTFVQNEYYPETPNVDTIVYKIYANDDVMYTALSNGELDFVWNYSLGVSKNYQTALKKSDAVTLEFASALNCPAVLVFNNKNGLGSDKNVRLAISYALDYEKFKTYFGSEASSTPNKSFVPSAHVGYKETGKLAKDLNKASEYMTAAGYSKENGVWKKDGVPATLTLTVNSGKETHVSYAEFVKTDLDAFGISVTLDAVDGTHYNEKTSHKFATEGSHGYGEITMECAIMGYTAFGVSSDLGAKYINGNHAVQGGAEVYSDELTKIINDFSSASNMNDYVAAAERLQDFYASELPVISLFSDGLVYARSSSLGGIVIDATYGLNNANLWFSITK